MADTKTWDEVPVTSPTGAERVHVAPDANSDGHMTTQQIANLASGLPAARLAATAAGRVFGRASGAGAGAGQELTPAQVTALLDTFNRLAKGLVPASGGTSGTANFLREDGQWASPPAGTGNVNSAAPPLALASGALTINTVDAASLPTAAFADAADLVGLDAAGNPAQFSGTAMAAWHKTQANLFRFDQVNISGGVLLDATVHNNRLIRATAALTISAPASLPNFGAGCSCFVLNDSSGNVTFAGTGMVGLATLAPGQMAHVFSYDVPGGTPAQAIRVVGLGGGGAVTSISIASIANQTAGAGFTVTGTLSGYTSAPTLSYSNDGTTYTAFPGGSTITSSAFSFTMPGLTAGTGRLVYVRDGSGVTTPAVSNSFTVTTPSVPTITIQPPGSALFVAPGSSTVNVPVTLALAAFGSAPTLRYSIDGTSPPNLALPAGNSVNSTAATFTIPTVAAGSFTLRVQDVGATASIATRAYSIPGATLGSVPTSGFSSAPLTLSSTTVTLAGISPAFAILARSGTNEGTALSFADQTAFRALSLVPALTGSYTLRIYDAASGGNLLAESGTITVAAQPTITINALGSAPFIASGSSTVNVPITATLANFGSAPTLLYSIDGSAPSLALPAGNTVTSTSATFTLPNVAAGSFTLRLRDSVATAAVATLAINVGAVSIASVPTSGWAVSTDKALTGATATLTGLSSAFAVLWDGSAEVGTGRQSFTSSATFAALIFRAATANSTHRIRIYSASTGGTLLAETATFTVNAAPALVLVRAAVGAPDTRGTLGPYTIDASIPVANPASYVVNSNWWAQVSIWDTASPGNLVDNTIMRMAWHTAAALTATDASLAVRNLTPSRQGSGTLAAAIGGGRGDYFQVGFTAGPTSAQGATVGTQWYQVWTITGVGTFYVGPFSVTA